MVREKLKIFKENEDKSLKRSRYTFDTKDNKVILEHQDKKINLIMSKWNEEVLFNISLDFVESEDHKVEGNKIEVDDGKNKVRAYPLGQRSTKEFYGDSLDEIQCEDGGVRFEIELSEKPKNNIFTIPVQSKNLRFRFQKPLSQEEKDNGARRALNIERSYAVYHKFKKGNQYMNGKVFHIYRPIIIDAKGNKCWGDLNFNKYIDPTILTLTVPQKFLDEAVYPVIIDPDLGYTTVGTSSQYIAYGDVEGKRCGTAWAMPSGGGNATSVKARVFANVGSTAIDCKAFINQKDSVSSGSHGQIATATNAACAVAEHWETFTMGNQSLTATTNYIFNVVGDCTDGAKNDEYHVRYDNDGGTDSYTDGNAWGSEESPWVDTADATTRDYSVYLVYATEKLKTLSESFSYSDSVLKSTTRTLSESQSLSDDYSKVWTVLREYSEAYSLSEGDAKQMIKTLSESLSFSDAYSKVWTALRTYSESNSLTDAILKSTERTLSESQNLSDAVTATRQLLKTLLEEFSLSDAYSKAWTALRTYSESLSLSDGDSELISRILSESYSLSGSVLKNTQRSISESLSLSDIKTSDSIKVLSESISSSDILLKSIEKSLLESLSLSDGDLKNINKILSESMGLSDILLKGLGITRTLSETFSLSDDFTATKMLLKILSESFNLSDGDSKVIYKLMTESFGLADIVYYPYSGLTNDFGLGPLDGFSETVTRTPVTVSTNFSGQKTYTDSSTEDIEGIFINPDNFYALDKSGLTEVCDALMFVKGDVTINKYDKILYDSETYRVMSVDDRQQRGIIGFKSVKLYLIE